jgi:signal transduction histidine kinase
MKRPGGEQGYYSFGLWGYLFLCFGIVAAVPVLILGTNEAHRWEDVQREEIDREARFVAEGLAREISDLVGSHVEAVEALAGQVQAFKSFDPGILKPIINAQKTRFGNFSFMYIAGRDGRSITTEPPLDDENRPTAGTDYSDRDYYKELMKTRETTVSRVQIGKRTHVPNVQIVSPILDGSGKMVGFAEGSLDLTGIQEAADRIIKGIPGLKSVVIDEEGRVIAHPDEVYRLSVKNLADLPLFQPSPSPGVVLRSGKDSHGVMMRAAVAGIQTNSLNWTVLVYRPEAVILEQAAPARRHAIWVAGLALLAGLSFATVLVGVLTRPVQRLAAAATAVGQGNFSKIPSQPASWVPREMAVLQIAVRNMILQLSRYTKDLEVRVRERTEQLKDSNRELESFVYTVSHDLKSPVVSLHGMASILLEDYSDKLDDQGKHYLQRVAANATFMEQLIADLLTLSRTVRRAQKPERLNADALVGELVDQCQETIRQRGVVIKIHSPLPEVVFDATHFRQIFLNLLTNAIKFLGDQSAPMIEIGGRSEDGFFVEYYFKDNGIGIDPRYHDLVFGIFQRLKEVEVEGTGVGLAIVKKIIDSVQGKIWIESERGKGTAFFFQLPSQEAVPEKEYVVHG